MEKDLTFDELTHLVGATVLSCDFDGNAVEEYVVEEYDSEHGRVSVSRRIDNRVTSIWPEELYMWHFRFPGRCPPKFWECSKGCAWFNEDTGLCAVFRLTKDR